jgi:hypothetical protein
MADKQQPAIVAELGRPETAEETAARKAANSRKHRANQTLFNLVIALVASLAIVLFLVVVVVRPAPTPSPAIDYATIAADAQGSASDTLTAPALSDGWSANAARFGTRSEVPTWYIGFITPSTQFIALNQGVDANPTWQGAILEGAEQTGTTSIDGVTWQVFDQRTSENPGNFAYALAATIGASTIVLHGTASESEFETLATSVIADLEN